MEKTQSARCALVIIGNEILSGRTGDANTQYIATKMAAHGVPLREVRIVADEEDKVVAAVNALRAEYDHVFTTGGIGPTHDDITSTCIAKAFGVDYALNDDADQILLEYYGADDYTTTRQKMAMMPDGVSLIPNPVSGAPGFIKDNVYVMAGIPRVMQAMLDHVITQIAGGAPILSQTINFHVPESELAQALESIQNRFPQTDIGSYPGFRNGKLWTSVVIRCADEAILEQAVKDIESLESQFQ